MSVIAIKVLYSKLRFNILDAGISNDNATIFAFGEPTLGDCADTGNVAFSSRTACVYMALNRVRKLMPLNYFIYIKTIL